MKALALAAALLTAAPPALAQQELRAAPPPGQPAPPPPAARPSILPRTPVVLEREHLTQRLEALARLLEKAQERGERGRGQQRQLERALDEVEQLQRLVAEAPEVAREPRPTRPGPVAQPLPMREPDFQQLLGSVKRERWDDGRLAMIDEAARYHFFTVEQVRQLIGVLTFSSKRLPAVRTLWPRVVDRQNGYQLVGTFDSERERRELRELMAQAG